MIIEDISEVMWILDNSSCPDCLNLRGYISPIINACLDGQKIIFSCKSGDHSLEAIASNHLRTTQADFDELSKELLQAIRNSPQINIKSFQDAYQEQLKIVLNKARVYAQLSNPDKQYSFDGFCKNCRTEVPMSVKNKILYTSCEPCASLIADSVD